MISLNHIYSDHMVLQREKKIIITGMCSYKAKVTVMIPALQLEYSADADENGSFEVEIPPQKAGKGYTLIIKSDKDCSLQFDDVCFGEVWLAAGQSNMEFELGNCKQATRELAWLEQKKKDGFDDIRFYYTVKAPYENEEWKQKQADSHWQSVTSEQGHTLSAVAYFAAKKMFEELQVPIGIINCNHGGTSISCWMQKETLETFPEGQNYLERYSVLVGDKTNEMYLAEMEEYNKKLANYNRQVERVCNEAQIKGEILDGATINELVGPYPWPQPQGWLSPYRPAGLVETMLKNVVPYTMKGVFFYQGEEDAPRYKEYAAMLSHMIFEWRTLLKDELPFVLLQLPMYLEKGKQDDLSWAYMREIQAQIAKELNDVYYIPLCDLGEYDNVHPTDKQTPGFRLAEYTLNQIYHDSSQGLPLYIDQYVIRDHKVVLHFINTYDGFWLNQAKQGEEPDLLCWSEAVAQGVSLEGFEIAGADGVYYRACGLIEDDFIILYSDKVAEPESVRYAFRNYMRANIYNSKGMCLAPFRTDALY